jgi:porphobilinogen deaminase
MSSVLARQTARRASAARYNPDCHMRRYRGKVGKRAGKREGKDACKIAEENDVMRLDIERLSVELLSLIILLHVLLQQICQIIHRRL